MLLPQEPIQGPVLALTPRPQVSSTFQVGMRKLDGADTTKSDKKPWMMFENMHGEPWLYFASGKWGRKNALISAWMLGSGRSKSIRNP